jgi:hypothetical protein
MVGAYVAPGIKEIDRLKVELAEAHEAARNNSNRLMGVTQEHSRLAATIERVKGLARYHFPNIGIDGPFVHACDLDRALQAEVSPCLHRRWVRIEFATKPPLTACYRCGQPDRRKQDLGSGKPDPEVGPITPVSGQRS